MGGSAAGNLPDASWRIAQFSTAQFRASHSTEQSDAPHSPTSQVHTSRGHARQPRQTFGTQRQSRQLALGCETVRWQTAVSQATAGITSGRQDTKKSSLVTGGGSASSVVNHSSHSSTRSSLHLPQAKQLSKLQFNLHPASADTVCMPTSHPSHPQSMWQVTVADSTASLASALPPKNSRGAFRKRIISRRSLDTHVQFATTTSLPGPASSRDTTFAEASAKS